MKRTLLAALAVTALAGAAVAQPGRGPSPGPGFGLLAIDANADGRVTRAELDASQSARFQAIDANRDGFATPEEFKAFHEKERAARNTDMTDRRFATLDTDGNGQISKAEFAAAQASRDKDRGAGRGGPGREFRAGGPGGRPGMGPGAPRDGGPARLGPDADGDGKVSQAEFSARAIEAFTRADTNKDGVVTIAELQAAGPARR